MGTPVVTLPGDFLRGRITLGLYRQMEYADCIAEDADDYVEKALALANDPAWARAARHEIAARSARIFDNQGVIEEHGRFFEWAVERARGGAGPASWENP